VTRAVACVLLAIAALLGPLAHSVMAEDQPPKCVLDCPKSKPTVSGGTGVLGVEATFGKSDTVPGRGDASYGEAPGRTEWKTVDEYITPFCEGNGLQGADALCMQAISTCPADNLIRFWVWHRVTVHRLGPPRTSEQGEWEREPGTYCLGADDPGVPNLPRAIAQVQSIFLELPLPVFETLVQPAPATLVNVPTAFSAGTAEPKQFNIAPLGIAMQITARPTTWTWDFGDGSKPAASQLPGGATNPAVTHTYEEVATFQPALTVTWTGTFRLLATGETFAIRAPAYVDGRVAPVPVREARTELVRD
jgi:hypothetical protein